MFWYAKYAVFPHTRPWYEKGVICIFWIFFMNPFKNIKVCKVCAYRLRYEEYASSMKHFLVIFWYFISIFLYKCFGMQSMRFPPTHARGMKQEYFMFFRFSLWIHLKIFRSAKYAHTACSMKSMRRVWKIIWWFSGILLVFSFIID